MADVHPLVIVGAPRSGTNILRDVLTSLEGFGTWPCDEINPIWRHGNATFPSDEFLPAQATPSVRSYLLRTFGSARVKYAGPTGILVEKTCATSLRVPFVDAVFPQARYLQIVRDGRDATASIMDRWTSGASPRYIGRKARFVPFTDIPRHAVRFLRARLRQMASRERRLHAWGPRFEGMDGLVRSEPLVRVCAHQWERCVSLSSDALEEMSAERWLRVRYEDLVTDPTATVTRVLSWLGGPAGAVAPSAVAAAVGQVRGGRAGSWTARVPPAQMETARDVLEPAMRRLGYVWSGT